MSISNARRGQHVERGLNSSIAPANHVSDEGDRRRNGHQYSWGTSRSRVATVTGVKAVSRSNLSPR